MTTQMRQLPTLAVGDILPKLPLKRRNGEVFDVHSDDESGNIHLLAFPADPASGKAAVDALAAARDELDALGVRVKIVVTGAPKGEFAFPVLTDPDGTVARLAGLTVALGKVKVTMVNATHSSAQQTADGPRYMGHESGYMIEGEGHTIYVSGDTDIMADMEWMADVHEPDIGILCAGGHFTMDMARASYAAKRYFDFKTVIPCHYRTFDALEQSADKLAAGLPGVTVIEPQVLEAIEV